MSIIFNFPSFAQKTARILVWTNNSTSNRNSPANRVHHSEKLPSLYIIVFFADALDPLEFLLTDQFHFKEYFQQMNAVKERRVSLVLSAVHRLIPCSGGDGSASNISGKNVFAKNSLSSGSIRAIRPFSSYISFLSFSFMKLIREANFVLSLER